MTTRRLHLWAILALFAAAIQPLDAQTRIPRLTVTRDLRIDATANNLSTIDALAVSRDGTIILLQSQDHLIRYFSAAGKSLGTVGREGSGPEEFRRPDRAGWLGDTLWVFDGGQTRTMLISPERKVLRTMRRPSDVHASSRDTTPSGSVYTPLLGLYPGGSQLLMVILPMRATSPRPPWSISKLDTGSPSVLLRVTFDGILEHVVGWAPADPCGYTMGTAYQLCGHPRADVSPDGNRIAFASWSVQGADSGTFRITVIGTGGDTIFTRRERFPADPIPARIRDSLITLAATHPGQPEIPGRGPTIAPPRVYPPVTFVVAGRDGTVWVQMRATPAGNPYRVFDAKGNPLGEVILPANTTIKAADRGHIWATEKDADDLESVVRYRVSP